MTRNSTKRRDFALNLPNRGYTPRNRGQVRRTVAKFNETWKLPNPTLHKFRINRTCPHIYELAHTFEVDNFVAKFTNERNRH